MCLRCWWSLALVADASVSRGRSSDGRLPAGINIFPTTSGTMQKQINYKLKFKQNFADKFSVRDFLFYRCAICSGR